MCGRLLPAYRSDILTAQSTAPTTAMPHLTGIWQRAREWGVALDAWKTGSKTCPVTVILELIREETMAKRSSKKPTNRWPQRRQRTDPPKFIR